MLLNLIVLEVMFGTFMVAMIRLYNMMINRGGYKVHHFGKYMGERHWDKLNGYDDPKNK